ncbi:MAG: hypothetical protein IKX79_01735, partial [Desulfovibrionaceae bacterium]|nr:hypothetical protein [Desulfovibrionaceae bacterium]
QQDLACAFSVTAAKAQQTGSYKLSSKLDVANGTAFSIRLGTESLGTAKVNGAALSKHGVTYKVTEDSSSNVTLTLSLKAGSTLKVRGTAGADTLTGTGNSDVFYGGKGNDVLAGVHGRDVAVYAKSSWGQDVIKATDGTMTLLFAGMKASDITQKKSGTSLVITRKSDSGQKITVQGWNDATHNIVFTDALTQFTKYVNAASPTTAQTNAARSEVWAKAGLAAKA